ncbi:hypothetical protein B0H21DRAFT_827943 [Amylocystis lapponica]|nr:hypothetical protein B0H21DRAFT_827943 [Amylocystis lapponica]
MDDHCGSDWIDQYRADPGHAHKCANPYTPSPAIYEQATLARITLFNYSTDPSGAGKYVVMPPGRRNPGTGTPPHLFTISPPARHVAAAQTFDTRFTNDKTLAGTVPALGVTLSSGVMDSAGTTTQMFPAATATNPIASATVNARALATLNGESGADRGSLSSTSKESTVGVVSSVVLLTMLLAEAGLVHRALM